MSVGAKAALPTFAARQTAKLGVRRSAFSILDLGRHPSRWESLGALCTHASGIIPGFTSWRRRLTRLILFSQLRCWWVKLPRVPAFKTRSAWVTSRLLVQTRIRHFRTVFRNLSSEFCEIFFATGSRIL